MTERDQYRGADRRQRPAGEFTADFASNIVERLDGQDRQLDGQDRQLAKIEQFLFTGSDERPSLQSFVDRADRHINVLCTYARWVKGLGIALVGLGGVAVAIKQIAALF